MSRVLRSLLKCLCQSLAASDEHDHEADPHPVPGAPLDPNDPAAWLSLDYIHNEVRAQLEAQAQLWEVVDGRLRLILGVITVVFAVGGALFQRTSWQAPSGGAPFPFIVGACAVIAIILFLGAAGVVAVAYWPSGFDRPPAPQPLVDAYLDIDPREVKRAVVDMMVVAYTGNEQIIARKNTAFKLAFVLTALATGLLGIGLLFQFSCETSAPSWLGDWWLFGASGC
jgi:hypothetical protein